MVREHLRTIPDDQVDVTLPVTIDALRYIDPADPAMPMYRVIADNRQPVALRDLMVAPRKLAFTIRALVVSANYRSAPEFAFPVPLDDAFDVHRWVVAHGDEIQADVSRIAVAGDSAGSNLAAAIPLRARDDGARVPDAVVMLGAFADFQFERWPSFLDLAPRGIVDYFPAGMPHGFYFFPGVFPGVHPEEAVAHDVVAKALAAPFGR